MGKPIFLEASGRLTFREQADGLGRAGPARRALDQPATSALVLALLAVWLLLHHRGLGYDAVGVSYDAVVQRRELWRLASSQVSHVDLLHIAFNVSALWSVGAVEHAAGTLYYLQQSALLILLCPLICMTLYHAMIRVGREEYHHVVAVGYSCVIFGWMALLAAAHPGGLTSLPLFGLASIPAWASPFGSLVITSVLIPKASFLGHLSGILAGYFLASGALAWLGPWPSLGMLAAALLGLAAQAARAGQLALSAGAPGAAALGGWLKPPTTAAADVESGGGGGGGAKGVKIVNGQIQRR
eukprot:scaffold26.g3370.t1